MKRHFKIWGWILFGFWVMTTSGLHAESLLPELEYPFYIAPKDSSLVAQSERRTQRRDTQSTRRSRAQDRKPKPPTYYSSLGLGKTLPGGFYRLRSITRMGRGSHGYDKAGKKTDLGFELNTVVQAMVVEYGLTEELSFQLLIPYVVKNQMALDYRKFTKTNLFQSRVSDLNKLLIGTMLEQGVCGSPEDCQQKIASGETLPENFVLPLPTGEFLPVGGLPLDQLQAQIPNLVKNGATPSDGETGVGDVDFGVLYVFHSTRKSVYAIGGGFRLPTGSFENVPTARRGTGEGLFRGAIRFNYDYNPLPPVWFSFQHQAEFLLLDGRKKKSSMLDPNELNQGDPTSDIAIEVGSDGFPNSQPVSQKGMRHHGLFRIDYGLGGLGSAFEPASIEVQGIYDFGAETTINGKSTGPAPQSYRYLYGLKLDGLGLDRPLPAYVKISQERHLSARNIPLAQNLIFVEFAFYTSL